MISFKRFFGEITLISVVFAIAATCGRAQPIKGLPVIENYSPLDYAAHRQNWDIAQAPNGAMYFANGKGVLSFDGERWNLTMVPNRGHVRSLDIDDDGTVFAGANNDIGKLTVDSSGNTKFQSFLPRLDPSDHEFGRIRKTICTPDGVYFQSYNRIFRFNGEELRIWRFTTTCYRIFFINNQLYAVDLDRGFLLLKNDEFVPAENGEFLKDKRINIVLPYRENLLIGTRNEGLFLYDNHNFIPFNTKADPYLLEFGLLKGLITQDDRFVFSYGTDRGIFILDKTGALETVINQDHGLASNDILSVFEDQRSSLWVGSQEGIARIDIQSPYSVYDEQLGLKGTVQDIVMFDDEIFAASSQGLMNIRLENSNYHISDIGDLNAYCWDIETWNNQLLLASSSGVYALKDRQLTPVMARPQSALAISGSASDSSAILIALDDGFIYQQWDRTEWVERGRVSGLVGAVRAIIENKKGEFWLKTRSNGLFRVRLPIQNGALDFSDPRIDHYDQKAGVVPGENNIFKIGGDFLVRSELDSLYRYDGALDRFVPASTFGHQFGIQEGMVLPKACQADGTVWLDYFINNRNYLVKAKKNLEGSYVLTHFPVSSKMLRFKDPYGNEVFNADDEHFWFCGMLGILQIDLEKLEFAPGDVPLVITRIKNNDTALFTSGGDHTKTTFAYRQNDLSFEFTAPLYQYAENLQYATMLEGYDQNWSNWGNGSERSYTNLPEGSYIFKVKAKNDFGVESDPVSYSFKIQPPWYRTTFAWIAYCLFAGFLIWLIVYLRSRKLRQNQFRLEALVKERTEEIEQQAAEINKLYQVKNRFLANISHEFRTPITLILGPTEQLLSSTKEGPEKQHLRWIHRNGQQLLKLINQLLDLSKLEAGKLELKASQQDLVQFCKYICSAFESLATQKNIKLSFESHSDRLFVFFDREKLEQVLNNLLFNAFKFTEEGSISVSVEESRHEGDLFAQVTVADSGSGIHPQQLPYVFERFYQANQDEETAYQGTGIGLALCKELIGLHSGKIEVESKPGKGSSFTFLLPVGRSHLKKEEIVLIADALPAQEAPAMEIPAAAETENVKDGEFPLILIVDDNEDMLDYIRQQLSSKYRILIARNGSEGLELGERELPDLIISDVMMPGMSGFELCSRLKNDIKTDHIPVILLTARTGEEYKIKGLKTQADEYIQKPFSSTELEVRVQNLIKNRKRLRKRFAEKMVFQPAEVAETPQESLFFRNLIEAVENNITDPQFDVTTLCKIMNMSKSQLNRKMKAVINKSPNQFIRSYRLEKARQMIKSSDNSLSEIAYDVGFSSPAYFSKCFHDEFGYPPSAVTE